MEEYEAQFPQTLSRQDLGTSEVGELVPQDPSGGEPEQKKAIDKPKNKAYIDLNEIIDTLSRDEQCLANALQSGPLHIDQIVEQTQLSAGQALASLTLLEVKGIVRRPGARMYELAEKI